MESSAQIATEELTCPLPHSHKDKIVLGHGSGGKMSHDLFRKIFLPCFSNDILRVGNDAGVVDIDERTRLAVSTDMHTVTPLFFPGGDIGKLAICGTVNDVAMMGATPLYLTTAFILEEGLDIKILSTVVASMKEAAIEAGVDIIAGDTKVVQKGKADGMYINTTGIGIVPYGLNIGGEKAQPGDVVILSGPIGDHGVAILAARGQLGFESDISSDIAPLNHLIDAMLNVSPNIHVLRDPTRGGLGTTLNEIAQQSKICITLLENKIPLRPAVESACEMLGFDPLYLANEGKLIAIVKRIDAEKVLELMRNTRYGKEAVIIGEVQEFPVNRVLLKTTIGGTRVVDMLASEILPRIC